MATKEWNDARSGTYTSWDRMLQRCRNPNDPDYPAYGAVGILVCEEWYSFKNFLADMGSRPHGKTLDRIDGKKGYAKENCRWATSTEQARNRITTKLTMEIAEKIRIMRKNGARVMDIAKVYGVCPSNISAVVHYRTWN